MTAYNDTNCNQSIISKHKFPCLQEKNCQCGKGICPQNETIVIILNYIIVVASRIDFVCLRSRLEKLVPQIPKSERK